MEMIALIVSGLALLAAGVCLCLLMQEKKRNQERNAAACDYVDASLVASEANMDAKFANMLTELQDHLLREIYSEDKKIHVRVENLEKGIIPDYEKATAAVNAVNDFNQGISNLLNYDPVSALAAQRERERQGE
jgi:hypothetical protein